MNDKTTSTLQIAIQRSICITSTDLHILEQLSKQLRIFGCLLNSSHTHRDIVFGILLWVFAINVFFRIGRGEGEEIGGCCEEGG